MEPPEANQALRVVGHISPPFCLGLAQGTRICVARFDFIREVHHQVGVQLAGEVNCCSAVLAAASWGPGGFGTALQERVPSPPTPLPPPASGGRRAQPFSSPFCHPCPCLQILARLVDLVPGFRRDIVVLNSG